MPDTLFVLIISAYIICFWVPQSQEGQNDLKMQACFIR